MAEAEGPKPKNYVGEWYGRRIFPKVCLTHEDLPEIEKSVCPFLSAVVDREQVCVKTANSSGVCTITTTAPELQDWLVCPYRAIEPEGFYPVIEKLFGVKDPFIAFPATRLGDAAFLATELGKLADRRLFLYFQDKLGGEISIPRTDRSPELSFDITIVEIFLVGTVGRMGQFAMYEIQTMDFHGSYRHAVDALRSAVNLHKSNFPQVLRENMEWAGRQVEGPNISNVFKRTFYQMMLKFRLADRHDCAGVALGLPESVWRSWSSHLGKPDLVRDGDFYRLADERHPSTSDCWIMLLNTGKSTGSIQPLTISRAIRISPLDLLARAFDDVPNYIAEEIFPALRQRILNRIRSIGNSIEWDTSAP